MIAGPGGNTTVQIGHEAVVVVDTQTAAVSDELLAAIAEAQLETDPPHHQYQRRCRAHGRQRGAWRAGTVRAPHRHVRPARPAQRGRIVAHVKCSRA